jgi:hypothetical protein
VRGIFLGKNASLTLKIDSLWGLIRKDNPVGDKGGEKLGRWMIMIMKPQKQNQSRCFISSEWEFRTW